MKGKGSLTTYWLTAADTNPLVNKEGLEALDAELKQVLYDADFGSKERSSHKQMDSFSPRKMQKVALSLDKLAMNVLQRTTKMNLNREVSFPEFQEEAPGTSRCRSDSINLDDLVEQSVLPQATDQVYDALADIVDRFNGISQEDVKHEIARALSNSLEGFDDFSPNNSYDEIVDLEDSCAEFM